MIEKEKGITEHKVWLFAIISTCVVIILYFLPILSSAREVVIETPSTCLAVAKVDGNKVYLENHNENCQEGPGRATISLPDTVKEVEIYKDGVFWKKQIVPELIMDEITRVLENAQELARQSTVPENLHQERGRTHAEKLAQKFHSPAYQEKLKQEQARLTEELFKDVPDGYSHDAGTTQKQRQTAGKLLESERVYVFITKSVPITTLRNYSAAIAKAGDPNVVMVLRGFVGGMKKIKPTMDFIAEILKKDPACDMTREKCDSFGVNIEIDPLLFRRYQICEVPAIVYAQNVDQGVEALNGSEGLNDNASAGNFFVIIGDAKLDYLLERINREAGSESLTALIIAITKGFY